MPVVNYSQKAYMSDITHAKSVLRSGGEYNSRVGI